ncbi:MAG: GNAT family N-acetyltransferase [Xenococcaceae cyanobacterium]
MRSTTVPQTTIRQATESDFEAMLPVFLSAVAPEENYVFTTNASREDIFAYWFAPKIITYAIEVDGTIAGMAKLTPNFRELGSHVANLCMVIDPTYQDRGIGKTLAQYCLEKAKQQGYQAVQLNFVANTNKNAIALWQKLGFSIIGTSPKAFKHKQLGYVDVNIMHRFLND